MASKDSEDPLPFLEEGTEVSAKFKGAFCEAKIKRVDRIVKCKLTLKSNNESITVNDHQILGSNGQKIPSTDLKQGQLVYIPKSLLTELNVSTSSSANLQQAILNKIIDQSAYTVLFNDGDEKCLKRSFIRFKGEKHYLDSETLNNAPLNNPEHFLYPIKSSKQSPTSAQSKSNVSNNNNSKENNSASENESDSESISNTTSSSLKIAKNSKLGENLENNNEDEKEDKNDEEDDVNEENENSLDEDEDSSSTASSDDYPTEEKDRFVAQLYKFMDDRGTPLNKVPSINKVDLDLHKFFILVKKHGGFNKVTKQRGWGDIYKRLGLPNSNAANIINLKCSYKRYLHPYEDLNKKLGSTMCDLVPLRHSSSASTSKRSISSDSNRLFKTRYLNTPNTSQKKTTTNIISNNTNNKQQKQNKTNDNKETLTTDVSSINLEQSNNNNDQLIKQSAIKNESINEDENQNENMSYQEKEFTIESIANSYNNNISITNEDQLQQTEELTLFGMVQNINENFKKAKKEKQLEESECLNKQKSSNEKNLKNVKNESTNREDLKTPKPSGQPQKRPSSASIVATSKTKGRRSSADKQSKKIKNEIDDEQEDEEEEEEPKRKKKSNRLSLDLSEDSNNGRGVKRKNSISVSSSKQTSTNEDESENEKSMKDQSTLDIESGKKLFTSNEIELNKIVEVRYGNGKTTYHAKIVQIKEENQTMLVHYLGWNNRYDEWIKIDKIIKIFSDDYGSNRRRKNKSNNLSNSSNDPSSPKNNNESNNSTRNNGKTKNTDSKNTSKLAKRSSLSSISSSTSSKDDPKDDASSLDIVKENKKAFETKSNSSKNVSSKTRSSDSSSSISSSEIPVLNLSLSTSSSNSIKKATSLDSKNDDDSNDLTDNNEQKKTQTEILLSIKEEIMDYDTVASSVSTKNKTTSIDSYSIASSVTLDLIDSVINIIDEKQVKQIAEECFLNEKDNEKNTIKNETSNDKKGKSNQKGVNKQSMDSKQPNKSANKKENQSIENESVTCKGKILKQQFSNESSNTDNQESFKNEPEKNSNSKESLKLNSDEFKENSQNSSESNSNLNKPLNESNQQNQVQVEEKDKECLSSLTNNQKIVQTQPSQPEHKYPFHLIGCKFVGKQKIKFIEEQMRLCREEYAKLKNEIAAIDRKKKKLKRNLIEKSSSNSNHTNLNTNDESSQANTTIIITSSKSESNKKN